MSLHLRWHSTKGHTVIHVVHWMHIQSRHHLASALVVQESLALRLVKIRKALVLLEVRMERVSVLLVPLHYKDLASTSLHQSLDIHFNLLHVSYNAELIDPVLTQLLASFHWSM